MIAQLAFIKEPEEPALGSWHRVPLPLPGRLQDVAFLSQSQMLHYEPLAKVNAVLAPRVVHGNKRFRGIEASKTHERFEASWVTVERSDIVYKAMNNYPATLVMVMVSHCKLLPVQTKSKVEELPIANRLQLCLLVQEFFVI